MLQLRTVLKYSCELLHFEFSNYKLPQSNKYTGAVEYSSQGHDLTQSFLRSCRGGGGLIKYYLNSGSIWYAPSFISALTSH